MVTEEKAIQVIRCTNFCGLCTTGNCKQCEKLMSKEMAINALEKQTQNNGWIPVSEKLPDKAFGCLVTVMDCEPSTQTDFENILPYFVGYDGQSWNDADGEEIPFEVIAWQQLPKPYKLNGSVHMEHDGCKGCKYERYTENSEQCKGCKQNAVDKYTRMTNADRIRAMSDEELAELLNIIEHEGIQSQFDFHCVHCLSKLDCKICWKSWLELKTEV